MVNFIPKCLETNAMNNEILQSESKHNEDEAAVTRDDKAHETARSIRSLFSPFNSYRQHYFYCFSPLTGLQTQSTNSTNLFQLIHRIHGNIPVVNELVLDFRLRVHFEL